MSLSILTRVSELRRQILHDLMLLERIENYVLRSFTQLAWDHEEIEQAQIEGRFQKALAIENGVIVPGDPEYDEEVAECHVHQTARRLPTSSD